MCSDHVTLAVHLEEVADSSSEDGTQRQEEAGPHGSRDRDARDEDGIADPEDPRGDRERHPKSRNVPSDHERPDAPSTEPPLSLVAPRGRQVQQVRKPVLDDRTPPAPGDEIQVGGSEHDDGDQAEPGSQQGQQALRTLVAGVHDEDIAGHWHRNTGLFQVEEHEGGCQAESPQKKADEVRAVPEGLGEVSFEDREQGNGEDRREQYTDGPAAMHLASTLPMVPEQSLKPDRYIGDGDWWNRLGGCSPPTG
jgi:hypothetical protein